MPLRSVSGVRNTNCMPSLTSQVEIHFGSALSCLASFSQDRFPANAPSKCANYASTPGTSFTSSAELSFGGTVLITVIRVVIRFAFNFTLALFLRLFCLFRLFLLFFGLELQVAVVAEGSYVADDGEHDDYAPWGLGQWIHEDV